MAGPYAHITLLNQIRRSAVLDLVFSSRVRTKLEENFGYCLLGAISPDYPNLCPGQAHWADVMHCQNTGDTLRCGIRRVASSKGPAQAKQLAWLLGYASHMAADLTIHPIVQAKVGPYHSNRRQHRVCEMHQDSYIYRRNRMGEIGDSDPFGQAIAGCADQDDPQQLDRDIVRLWSGMLAKANPLLYANEPPTVTGWHRQFLARLAPNPSRPLRLFPMADLIASPLELPYPRHDQVDREYIERLPVSGIGLTLHYDEIFDRAIANAAALWSRVELAFTSGDVSHCNRIGNWNLDDGTDENGNLALWTWHPFLL